MTDRYDKTGKHPATALGNDSTRNKVHYDSNAEFLTAAAKILQTATMSDDGLAVLKSQAPDLVTAVNVGFDLDAATEKLTRTLNGIRNEEWHQLEGDKPLPDFVYGYKKNEAGGDFVWLAGATHSFLKKF